jgi:hypothetical protein
MGWRTDDTWIIGAANPIWTQNQEPRCLVIQRVLAVGSGWDLGPWLSDANEPEKGGPRRVRRRGKHLGFKGL